MRVEVHAADVGGCGHYRMIWPAQALNASHVDEVDVKVITPDMPEATIECTAAPRLGVGRRELTGLVRPPECDVVVFQRPLTAQLVRVIELHQAAGVAVVVEVDDDFHAIHPRNSAWATVQPQHESHTGRSIEHLARACELADLVTVTTPALARRYASHGRVAVLPNYVPSAYLAVDPSRIAGADVKVGWSGALETHPTDLQVTRGAVGRVLRERGLPFHVVGDGDAGLYRALGLDPSIPLAHTGGWLSLDRYPDGMAQLDVGIVPLDLTPFNQAKSWLKGLEFAALGVPFIASPTDPYLALHDAGIGLIATKPKDWRRLVSRLVDSPEHRAELAGRQRQTVAESLTVEQHAGDWLDAWRDALDNAARRGYFATIEAAVADSRARDGLHTEAHR